MLWRFFWPVTWMALGLVIVPSLLWLANWHWQPYQAVELLYPFYLITETVTRPWGAISTGLLFLWFFILFRKASAQWVRGLILTAVILFVGQFSVNHIKPYVQETRPYSVWLTEQTKESKASQQAMDSLGRGGRLFRQPLPNIPDWQRNHWQKENSYSFPSGHSMYASCWALLAVAFFWSRKYYVSCLIIWTWAMLVISSRLLLGMHWPWDVIGSTFIAWCLVILGVTLANRCNYRQ